jgi:hypothetical protein
LLLFDLNTVAAYRGFFASDVVQQEADLMLVWSGHGSPTTEPGSLVRASFAAFARETEERWERVTVEHVQRHHPEPVVTAALAGAGLEWLAVYGHGTDGVPHPAVDEAVDTKAVYLARPARPMTERR